MDLNVKYASKFVQDCLHGESLLAVVECWSLCESLEQFAWFRLSSVILLVGSVSWLVIPLIGNFVWGRSVL